EELLHPRDLLAVVARVLLGLEAELVRALAGLDERFLAPRVRVPLGVAHDPRRLLLGPADRLSGDALAVGNPPGHRRGGGREGDEDVEDVFEGLGGHRTGPAGRSGLSGRSGRSGQSGQHDLPDLHDLPGPATTCSTWKAAP